MKLLLPISLCFLLFSCSGIRSGTLTKDGTAYIISITQTDFILTEGSSPYEVFINGLSVGKIKLVDKTMTKHTYEPLKTKFGVLRAETIINFRFTGDIATFDFYLDDSYAGSIKMAGGYGD